jgi:hypothetical protein
MSPVSAFPFFAVFFGGLVLAFAAFAATAPEA